MIVRFPNVPMNWSQPWMNQVMASLQRYFGEIVGKDQETPRIILRSPNGTNYDVTVSDAGALVVTATEKTRA